MSTVLSTQAPTLQRTSRHHGGYEALLRRCQGYEPIPVAVAFPADSFSLGGALDAALAGLIIPILVGPAKEIQRIAAAECIDIGGLVIVDAPDEASAAALAVGLVREKKASVLMKGSLHTNVMMHAVMDRENGLRASRRISHAFIFDVPAYPKALFLTDAAINIAPDLETKADICRNAIELAHALGNPLPKVAILAAVETVEPSMASTIDAAALCKMADRGQITGAVLDGPLAMDNAVSLTAAATKHIASPVAGDADILVVPNLEAGNILYKNLTYLAGADAAGVVLGASVPIILTSRADSIRTRIASAALAAVLSREWGDRTLS